MFQSDTVWTSWLYSARCLKREQDSPVIAYFKWINSVLRWNVIVTENSKILSSSIRTTLTIFDTGATGIIHYFNLLKCIPTSCCTGQIAQSVQRLATGWTVRGSNPEGEARFSAPVQTGPGAFPAFFTMVTESFPAVQRPGLGVDHPPHLVPRLKKE